uniref:Thioredoxin-like fold domain-containing protein n=1 Tax=Panagrolaimus sp. PS1159 TaxID=55785 RepID=A0AC35F759_9BILA
MDSYLKEEHGNWLYIPFGDENIDSLSDKYHVSGIPTFVILKPDGSILNEDGRSDVEEKSPSEISLAIQCYRFTQNGNDQVPIDTQIVSCPPAVRECFKFVCMAQTPFITKGCINYQDQSTQPETLRAQCAGRNGYGNYYNCNNNVCNSARNYPVFTPLMFSTAAVMLTFWKIL